MTTMMVMMMMMMIGHDAYGLDQGSGHDARLHSSGILNRRRLHHRVTKRGCPLVGRWRNLRVGKRASCQVGIRLLLRRLRFKLAKAILVLERDSSRLSVPSRLLGWWVTLLLGSTARWRQLSGESDGGL